MKFFISAAESSSDAHGAQLLKALRVEAAREFPGETVEAFGLGGPHLAAAGLRQVWDARTLLAMGFVEVLGKLFTVLRAQRALIHAIRTEKPDVAIFIDYPDFHFRLAKKIRSLGIPHIYYIPPKLWVWRKRRGAKLRQLFDQVLCIFPFEEDFYQSLGVRCKYVGNPLLDELPLDVKRSEARQKLQIAANRRVLVVMPGGRPSELKYHYELFLRTAESIAQALKASGFLPEAERLLVLMPFPLTLSSDSLRALPDLKNCEVRVSFGDAPFCLLAADAGLIKSGTSTLEAGVLGLPHVCVYKPSPSTEWIFKNLIRYRGPVGLVNLVANQGSGPNLIEEITCDQVTVAALTHAVSQLFVESRGREVRAQLGVLKEKLRGPEKEVSPSCSAARAVMAQIKLARASALVKTGRWSLLNLILSGIWSSVNYFGHLRVRSGFVQLKKLDSFVIGVGNIQAGGAGKTPFVASVAKAAHDRGLRVCILLRGYRGAWENSGGVLSPGEIGDEAIQAGDEALLLKDLCPFAWIGVGKDRLKSFETLLKRLPPGHKFDVVLLDDAFQNWKIKKDLDVVLMTGATRAQTVFRDFSSSLRWADALIWTKGRAPMRIKGRSSAPWVGHLEPRLVFVKALAGSKAPRWLISGVAAPQDLVRLLVSTGIELAEVTVFPDHFSYSKDLIEGLLKQAEEKKVSILITAKDWVKWKSFGVSSDRVEVVDLEFYEPNPDPRGSLWDRILCLP